MSIAIKVTLEKGLRSILAEQIATETSTEVRVDHIGKGACVLTISTRSSRTREAIENAFAHTGLSHSLEEVAE